MPNRRSNQEGAQRSPPPQEEEAAQEPKAQRPQPCSQAWPGVLSLGASCPRLYSFSTVAITNDHKLSGLKGHTFIFSPVGNAVDQK